MIDSFILDFYCSKLMLGIEIDGESHEYNEEYDIQINKNLRYIGIKISRHKNRYKNEDVFNDIEGIDEDILEEIKIRKKEIDC